MRCTMVTLGSFLTGLFIVFLYKGRKYFSFVEYLEESEFPFHELYVVGYVWSSRRPLALQGKLAAELKACAGLLYEARYAEYYANVAWVQCITFIHLFSACTLLLGAIMYELATLIVTAGIFLMVLAGVYSLQNMKDKISKRTKECEVQLPEVVSTIAILVSSGMMLREAWYMVASQGTGQIYELMRASIQRMDNGYSDGDAIYLFGQDSNSAEVKKFTSSLLQNMERGSRELPVFLAQQSSELWNAKRQKMLQEGEQAATKLLGPIVLIFFGIIIIVITAAFAGALF